MGLCCGHYFDYMYKVFVTFGYCLLLLSLVTRLWLVWKCWFERTTVYLIPCPGLEIMPCLLLGHQVSVCAALAVRDCWGSMDWLPGHLSSPLVGRFSDVCPLRHTLSSVRSSLFLCGDHGWSSCLGNTSVAQRGNQLAGSFFCDSGLKCIHAHCQ